MVNVVKASVIVRMIKLFVTNYEKNTGKHRHSIEHWLMKIERK